MRDERGRLTVGGVYAAVVVWLRFVVAAAWVAGAVLVTLHLPSIGQAGAGGLGALVPHDAPALRAEARSLKLFGFPVLSRTIDVQRRADGLSAAAQARVVARVVRLNRHGYPDLRRIAGAYALTNALGALPFAREHGTTALTFLFVASGGTGTRAELADRLGDEHIDRPGEGFVGATGTIPARYAYENAIGGSLGTVTLATVLFVLALVGWRFRSVGAPLLNLVAVGISYLVSVRVVALIAERAGIGVPKEVQPVIVVLLFGVVTDYSVFFLDRFGDRLRNGEHRRVAARRTTAELLPIIVTAGLTVVLASASLIVSPLDFFRAFGPGLALAVLVGLVVSVTLAPALLAIFGGALFWPRRPHPAEVAPGEPPPEPGTGRRRPLSVRLAARFPIPVALVCLALLGLGISRLGGLELGGTAIRGLPADSQPRRAYDAATRGFAPGILAPTVVVLDGTGVARQRPALGRLQRALAREPGVAGVLGPRDNPLRHAFGAALSRSGDAARYLVVLDSAPYGAHAISELGALRERLPGLARRAGVHGAQALIAGDTAVTEETIAATRHSLALIVPVALGVILLVLVVFLRSLVAPIYLMAAAVLAPAAALGVTAYVFQGLLGYGQVTYYVPVTTMVLLIALGSDYNVYLVGRVWEEARRHTMRDAVLIGAGGATRAISTAGVALAGSFALLALVPLLAFRQVALTMAAGLLIDAFLVRALLIPAVIVALGRLSGWPGHALRRDPEPATAPVQRRRARVASAVTGRDATGERDGSAGAPRAGVR